MTITIEPTLVPHLPDPTPAAPVARALAPEAAPVLRDPPRPLGALELVDLLLRDRSTFLDRISAAAQPLLTARALLVTCLMCTAVFGASIGAYRGGIQVLFAAIKLPLAVLLTASLVAPALTALSLATRGHDDAFDVRPRLERDLVLVLAALALGGLVIAALVPLVLLGLMFGASYHAMSVALFCTCCAGGAIGLSLFARGMARRSGRGRLITGLGTVALMVVVGSQMTWSLRPFLLRPRTEGVPFVRAVEGSLLDSVSRSTDSARGIYEDADLEER